MMHTALWITGIGSLVLFLLAYLFSRDQKPDDAMATSFFVLAFGAGGCLMALGWLGLVFFKAASA